LTPAKRPQNGHRCDHDAPPTIVRIQPQHDGSWYARLVDPDDYPGQCGTVGNTPGAALDSLVVECGIAVVGVSVILETRATLPTPHRRVTYIHDSKRIPGKLEWKCQVCGCTQYVRVDPDPLDPRTLKCSTCGALHETG
jgi:hypothetical protein